MTVALYDRPLMAVGVLASAVNSTQTSLPLVSASKFTLPAVGYAGVIFNRALYSDPADDPNHEVVFVTGKSANSLTVARGQEGTIPRAHDDPAGEYVIFAALTPRHIDQIEDELQKLESAIANIGFDPVSIGADPTGVSDSTSFIQLCLDTYNAIKITPGTYKVTAKLQARSGIRVFGTHRESCILKAMKDPADPWTFSLFSVEGCENVELERLTFTQDVTNAQYNGVNDVGKLLTGGDSGGAQAKNIRVRDCYFRDCSKQAIAAWATPVDWEVSGCKFERIGRGAAIFNDATNCRVVRCSFYQTGDDGIGFLVASKYCKAWGNHLDEVGALKKDDDTLVVGGAAFKVHGRLIEIFGNTIVKPLTGAIRIQPPDGQSFAGKSPDKVSFTDNLVDGLFYTTETIEQAAIRLDDVEGRILIAKNIVSAHSTDANYDIVRVEDPRSLELIVEENDFVSNIGTASARFGINCTSCPKRLQVRNNVFDVLSNDIWIGNGDPVPGTQPTLLAVERNNFVATKTAEIIKFQSGGIGVSRLTLTQNLVDGNTGTDFIQIASNPVDLLVAFLNDKGAITGLLGGAGSVTERVVVSINGGLVLGDASTLIGYFGGTPAGRPAITGSRGGVAALTDLLADLGHTAGSNFLQDSTTG